MSNTLNKARHKNLIRDSLQIFEEALVAGVELSIKSMLDDLFKSQGSSQGNLELNNSYNQLRKEHQNIISELTSVTVRMPDDLEKLIQTADEVPSLSLIEEEELEVTLALTEMESIISTRFFSDQIAMEKRLKVLFANRFVSKNNMPFGSSSICWILSQTLDKANISLKIKLSLIGKLKTELVNLFSQAYDLMNQEFVEAGILANLNKKPKAPEQKVKTPSTPIEKTAEDYDREVEAMQDGLIAQENKQQAPGAKSDELISSIFALIKKTQGSQPIDQGSSVIDDQTMDRALDNLSKVTSVSAGEAEIDKLKEMILDEVRNETGVFYPSLSQRQRNSLDLLGMFYEHVKKDHSLDSNILSSLNAINIPLIRTAVTDQDFFNENNHPARKYLENILLAAKKWNGTSVVKTLHKYSSTVAENFAGNIKAFTSANDDVESFLRLTERRAKNAEEKWVNAAKGKEKLESSRQIVNKIIEDLVRIAKPQFIKRVMKYVIQDSLTLTLLRHGEDSEHWNKKTSHYLSLAKMANQEAIKELNAKQKLESLHHLDQTMDELGFSDNDRYSTINNFKECAQAAMQGLLDERIELVEVAAIKQDDSQRSDQPASEVGDEDVKLTQEQKVNLTKFKLLPYGTLFEFYNNETGEKVRRKLSWLSPVSNKALFVSMQGLKPFECTMNYIAKELHNKNLSIIQLSDQKYFKMTMTSILDTLNSMLNNR